MDGVCGREVVVAMGLFDGELSVWWALLDVVCGGIYDEWDCRREHTSCSRWVVKLGLNGDDIGTILMREFGNMT